MKPMKIIRTIVSANFCCYLSLLFFPSNDKPDLNCANVLDLLIQTNDEKRPFHVKGLFFISPVSEIVLPSL